MKAVEHDIIHRYQTANHNCSQTSVSMMLSFFGEDISPDEIQKDIPVTLNDKGQEHGTVAQQLATWGIHKGFDVALYSADCEILNLPWANLPKEELLSKMRTAMPYRHITNLGKEYSQIYMQAYVDFVEAGGDLKIVPYISSELLYELVKGGPLTIGFCILPMYGLGHTKLVGLRKEEPSDTGNGQIGTHEAVVYGYDEDGNFLIADPWVEPGRHAVKPEQVVAAIAASQIECDNYIYQFRKKA